MKAVGEHPNAWAAGATAAAAEGAAHSEPDGRVVKEVGEHPGDLVGGRFLPDRLLRLHDVPRTVSLIVLAALTVAAALLNAFATLPLLGLAAFLSGFSFGGFQVPSNRRVESGGLRLEA